MALEDYAKKRTFTKTPEPSAETPPAPSQTRTGEFCVQRHRARHLHYDLRIEIGGVLKSWAVPEGPSLDPNHKRLAVHVEDHPMMYSTFEAVIPPGNYGAGSMMLWDHGSYEVIGEPSAEEQLERGDFKFKLHGKKLHGDFVLVRTKQNQGRDWLLIKKKDQHTVDNYDIDLYPLSVKTGRTQEEIAAGIETGLSKISGAIEAPMPATLSPMMAFPAAQPPSDPGWLFEIKWDGVRALCFLEEDKLRIISRNANPMDRQYPELSVLSQCISADAAILDGEIVALDERGIPSFGLLQRRMHVTDSSNAALLARTTPVVLYLFDILYLDGWDLRRAAIEDRKRLLASVFTPHERVKLSDHFLDQGKDLLHLARQSGLEGIVAKRLGSPYETKRSPNWLKIKIVQHQDFVICGYTTGDRDYFSSLILGLYENEQLTYVGNVGSGFNQETLELVHRKLEPLVTPTMPFPQRPGMLHPPVWTKPELVCETKFSSWTDDKHLRAPVFIGLRNDINPKECVFEIPANTDAGETKYPVPPPLIDSTIDKAVIEVDSRRLTFTNLNKLYYPADNIVKRDVINYYHQAASLILPYLRDRALSLRRYPDGIQGESFFQKEASEHFPSWMRIEPVHSNHNEAPIHYVVADDRATLLFLANLGCIDQNPWMSRISNIDHPDFLLIDLDPQDCDYDKIVEAAQLVRQKLERLGLTGYPKTTGGDGMHVYVPLEPIYTYETVRDFAKLIAHLITIDRPGLFTTVRAVSKREKNRVYFDWAQIASGKTISAPYVLRAYPGAPVATPLEWREVRPGLTPQQFHIRNVLERFARLGDIFSGVLDKPQRLEPAFQKLDSLVRR